jgi:hypothetical protein
MKLQEVLNKPADYQWKARSRAYWLCEFDVGGVDYIVMLNKGRVKKEWWEITFEATGYTNGRNMEMNKSLGLTKTGNEFVVFATVSAAVIEFIEEVNPSHMYFQAKEPSRRRLYARFSKMISKKYGYDVDIKGADTILSKKR